jgi:hypothetical protein
MKTIYGKILEAKKQIGTILKDSKNPFFKSNYLGLNGLITSVETVLQEQGLLLLQPLGNGGISSIIFDTESGEKVESFMLLPNIQDPQKLGSAITYFRRYSLQSLLCLQAEDDDGNSSTKQVMLERKEALTDSQFEKAKLGTINQINTTLNKFRMSTDQRSELTKLTKLTLNGSN